MQVTERRFFVPDVRKHWLDQALLLFCIVIFGCSRSSNDSFAAIESPDGSLKVIPSLIQSTDETRNGCIAFDVVDTDGTRLCSVQTKASNTMKWSLRWHDKETIVLTSSDIGTRAWEILDGKATELALPLPRELLDPTPSLAKDNQSDQKDLSWPDASIGKWIELTDESNVFVRLGNAKYQHIAELPDEGYVPVEAMGPTLKATVYNESAKYIAEVRILLKVIHPSGSVIARDVTDDAAGVRLIPPGEKDERTFIFDVVDSPLLDSEQWGEFEISADPVAARFVDLADVGM